MHTILHTVYTVLKNRVENYNNILLLIIIENGVVNCSDLHAVGRYRVLRIYLKVKTLGNDDIIYIIFIAHF